MSYIPESYTRNKNNIKVELDLSNYATKSDLKIDAAVNTLDFVMKVDLTKLKSDVDKLDIDQLKTNSIGVIGSKNCLKTFTLFRLLILVI